MQSPEVCGNASRLYKYLVADYFEQFRVSIHNWATAVFRVEAQPADQTMRDQQAESIAGFRQLYGRDVFPEELTCWFPLHWDYPHHIEGEIEAGQGATTFAEALIRHILIAEDHPVITRFWLFGRAVRRMCSTLFFTDAKTILVVGPVQPMAKQQRRLTLVHRFFGDAREMQHLKSATLSLRLTSKMLAVTSKKRDSTETPLVVDLTTTNIVDEASAVFAQILTAFSHDTNLDRVLALQALLTTFVHISGRCQQYQRYPYLLWKLTRQHNALHLLDECSTFLETPPEDLDPGSWVVMFLA